MTELRKYVWYHNLSNNLLVLLNKMYKDLFFIFNLFIIICQISSISTKQYNHHEISWSRTFYRRNFNEKLNKYEIDVNIGDVVDFTCEAYKRNKNRHRRTQHSMPTNYFIKQLPSPTTNTKLPIYDYQSTNKLPTLMLDNEEYEIFHVKENEMLLETCNIQQFLLLVIDNTYLYKLRRNYQKARRSNKSKYTRPYNLIFKHIMSCGKTTKNKYTMQIIKYNPMPGAITFDKNSSHHFIAFPRHLIRRMKKFYLTLRNSTIHDNQLQLPKENSHNYRNSDLRTRILNECFFPHTIQQSLHLTIHVERPSISITTTTTSSNIPEKLNDELTPSSFLINEYNSLQLQRLKGHRLRSYQTASGSENLTTDFSFTFLLITNIFLLIHYLQSTTGKNRSFVRNLSKLSSLKSTVITRSISNESSIDYCIKLVRANDYELYLSTLAIRNRSLKRYAFILRSLSIELSRITTRPSDHKEAIIGRLKFWEESLNELSLTGTKEDFIKKQPVLMELKNELDRNKISKYWLLSMVKWRRKIYEEKINSQFFYNNLDEIDNYSMKVFNPISMLLLERINMKHLDIDHLFASLTKSLFIVYTLKTIKLTKSPYLQYKLIPEQLLRQHQLEMKSFMKFHQNLITNKKMEENEKFMKLFTEIICDMTSRGFEHLLAVDTRLKELNEKLNEDLRDLLLPSLISRQHLNRLQLERFNLFSKNSFRLSSSFLWRLFRRQLQN
ncbi:hypothetical protein SNEBB_002567 [Seison nebaliae]|nr:hypothetical protein SNEBB_002567 [Seison nebaliae]